jgi:hypothetical protein
LFSNAIASVVLTIQSYFLFCIAELKLSNA